METRKFCGDAVGVGADVHYRVILYLVTCGQNAEDRDQLRNRTLVSCIGLSLLYHSVDVSLISNH